MKKSFDKQYKELNKKIRIGKIKYWSNIVIIFLIYGIYNLVPKRFNRINNYLNRKITHYYKKDFEYRNDIEKYNNEHTKLLELDLLLTFGE